MNKRLGKKLRNKIKDIDIWSISRLNPDYDKLHLVNLLLHDNYNPISTYSGVYTLYSELKSHLNRLLQNKT